VMVLGSPYKVRTDGNALRKKKNHLGVEKREIWPEGQAPMAGKTHKHGLPKETQKQQTKCQLENKVRKKRKKPLKNGTQREMNALSVKEGAEKRKKEKSGVG